MKTVITSLLSIIVTCLIWVIFIFKLDFIFVFAIPLSLCLVVLLGKEIFINW